MSSMNSEYLNGLSKDQILDVLDGLYDQFQEEKSMPNPDTARLEALERQYQEASNAFNNAKE